MSTDLLALSLAAVSGGVVALLLTLFGGGGSVLAVPLLLYLVGVKDPHVAIGVSAAGVSLNALTALAGQAKAGRVRWPCATLFAVTGAAGAWFGSSLAKMIDGHQLLLIFAVAMAAVGLSMLRPKPVVVRAEPRLNWAMSPRIGLAGAGVGSAAGFFGIGGGFLIVPGLMAATGMSLATAQATSLLSVAAFGATTAGNYALSGWIDPGLVAAMTVGGVAGTAAGLPLARRLGAKAALGRVLFAGLILLVAVYVAVRAIMAL
ncbi:sulfite exporter TauE/SafE family protein [Brevundimonas sp. SL130]|uniref:sulfite exporter TauE/SafE family protein n=1 Tax=Brevundimonas sp. SL130 TaxID=2995143 RepID=UPI00226C9A1F|nr:sulfite exporter TauE/SafE family protein [Brevundimonas sp. SL130]WAC60644.1 sulfite exporter TauE/SafE family protein [Brevundimonas sp. SL130]